MSTIDLNKNSYVIAEVGLGHEGSLGMACSYIDAVAETGADIIKFQTHIADAESSQEEPWRMRFSQQDERRIDYWKRTEFSEDQWRLLREHAEKRGLIFMSSPFSNEAVELLERIGVEMWKVPSGEVTNDFVLDRMMENRLPIVVSTGMSRLMEIDHVVEKLQRKKIPFALLQCTSMYPTPPEKLGLNVMQSFRERYQCPVGLSDHSGQIYPVLAAASLGATVFEVHVVFSGKMFGPDVRASLDLEELEQLVRGVRYIETAVTNPVDKDAIAEELRSTREIFTKSLVVNQELKAGQILTREALVARKPGTGIPVEQAFQFIGLILARDVKPGHFLQEDDLVIDSQQ